MPRKIRCLIPKCDFVPSTSVIGTSFLHTSDSVAMKDRAAAVGMLVEDIKDTHRICHKHFVDSDFIIGDNNFKRLRSEAVPTKFLVSSFTTRIFTYFLDCIDFKYYFNAIFKITLFENHQKSLISFLLLHYYSIHL